MISSWSQELFGAVDSEAEDSDEEGGSGHWRAGAGWARAARDRVQEGTDLSCHGS